MTEEYRQKILKERGKEYGDYKDSIKTISLLKEKILFLFFKQKKTMNIPFIYYGIEEADTIQEHIDFTRTMLALKAARSIYSKDEAYKDCIVDFFNYMTLYKEAIRDILSNYIDRINVRIEFLGGFNPLLNMDNKSIKDIEYLLEPNFIMEIKNGKNH